MHHISPKNAGLALGALLGLWHAVWSALVAFDLAQPLIDFVFRMHFIAPIYAVEVFDIVTAVELVVVTSIVGCVFGYIFALIWNKLHA
ncbi:MAG: hypothetical protein Q7S86_02945 [bacterium]|nr:hypothetical protein [bacterium]